MFIIETLCDSLIIIFFSVKLRRVRDAFFVKAEMELLIFSAFFWMSVTSIINEFRPESTLHSMPAIFQYELAVLVVGVNIIVLNIPLILTYRKEYESRLKTNTYDGAVTTSINAITIVSAIVAILLLPNYSSNTSLNLGFGRLKATKHNVSLWIQRRNRRIFNISKGIPSSKSRSF